MPTMALKQNKAIKLYSTKKERPLLKKNEGTMMIQTIVHCSTHVVTLKLNSSLGGRVLKAMIACMMLGSMAPAPHFWTFDMLIQTNKSPLDDKPPEPTPLKFNLQGRCKDYELRAFDLDLILFSSTNKIITIYKCHINIQFWVHWFGYPPLIHYRKKSMRHHPNTSHSPTKCMSGGNHYMATLSKLRPSKNPISPLQQNI